MSNACLKSIGISEFPLCFLRKPYDCLEIISNYRRHYVLKIILPSQARPNISKPKVKCSAVWGKGHWIQTPEAQPIVSCFVILYHLSVAMVVMCNKNPPTSVASDDKHWFPLLIRAGFPRGLLVCLWSIGYGLARYRYGLLLAELRQAPGASVGTTADWVLCYEVPPLPAGWAGLVLRAAARFLGAAGSGGGGRMEALGNGILSLPLHCVGQGKSGGQPRGPEIDSTSWRRTRSLVIGGPDRETGRIGTILIIRLSQIWGKLSDFFE